MRTSLVVTVAACGVAAGLAAAAHAPQPADPPPAMFRGDARHTGHADEPGLVGLELAWRHCTQGKIRSTPAVAGGLAVFGSEDGTVRAVSRTGGDLVWTAETGGPVTSSPAVAGGRVVVVGGDRALWALDLATGERAWRREAGPQKVYEMQPGDPRSWDWYASSPVIDGDTVYVGSDDGTVGAYALDTGEPRWRHQTGSVVRAAPAVARGAVYAGDMGGLLWALDAGTGKVRWTFDTEGNANFPRGEVQSSPAVAGGLVLFGSRDGRLYAVDAETGEQRWYADHRGSWVISSPAVAGGLAFAGSSDGQFVHAVDLEDGEERWRFPTKCRVFSSPTAAGGLVYVGTWDGTLLGLTAAGGRAKVVQFAEAAINSTPVVADGMVLVGSDDSCLYAFTGTPFDPNAEPAVVELEPARLEAIAGRYRTAGGGELELAMRDGVLQAFLGRDWYELLPVSPTELVFRAFDGRVTVEGDDTPEAIVLHFSTGEHRAERVDELTDTAALD